MSGEPDRIAAIRERVAKCWTDPDVVWLLNRLAVVEGERDEARAWVTDLHSGMFINCVYCGHRYGPNKTTPVSMADVLKAHIEQCPQHPLSEAKAALLTLQRQVAEFAQRCQDIRNGSPNAFYAHVDNFCKATLLPSLAEKE